MEGKRITLSIKRKPLTGYKLSLLCYVEHTYFGHMFMFYVPYFDGFSPVAVPVDLLPLDRLVRGEIPTDVSPERMVSCPSVN